MLEALISLQMFYNIKILSQETWQSELFISTNIIWHQTQSSSEHSDSFFSPFIS